jgi:hypothetical protein
VHAVCVAALFAGTAPAEFDYAPSIRQAAAESPPSDGDAADHATLNPTRDIPAEQAALAECMSGPGAAPTPADPLTAGNCLDLFDYDQQGEVDLADASVYLTTVPPPIPPELEIGRTVDGIYKRLKAGDIMPVHRGFQGGTHIFVSLRGRGFVPDSFVFVTRSGVMVDGGETVVETITTSIAYEGLGAGVSERANLFVGLALDPGQADGREADLTFTIEDYNAPSKTATITLRVLFEEIQ